MNEKIIAIGSCAFSNCTKLTSVKFNEKLNTIGDNAFNNCKWI